MPRKRKSRQWVKIDCEGILRGSINYLLTLEGQAIWVKLIALSEVSGGRAGFIEDNNQKGLPQEYIAHELHCTSELLEEVLSRMESDGAVKRNGSGSIELVNFKHYQFNEYDRQKVYRMKSTDGAQTFEEYVEAIRKDYSDLNIEKELEKFRLWWSEGNKELKRPKIAFRNWLDKAREIRQNGTNRGSNKVNGDTARNLGENDPGKYKRGKYGHLVQ